MKKKTGIYLFTAVAAAAAVSVTGIGIKNVRASRSGAESTAPSSESTGTKLKVVASFYPMADFAQKVGGDQVEVTNMVPAGTEPHDWEPSAKDIKNLENSDVFVYNGAGMEHWAEDILESLDNKDIVVVEASKGLELLKGSSHEEEGEAEDGHEEESEDGHDHGDTDPHVWLAPENAKKEMENIKNGLEEADADHKDVYEKNYETWSQEFDKLDQEFKDGLADSKTKNVITAHEAFGYLCKAYGLTQMGIEGLTPDSEPDPDRMEEIIKFAQKNDVKTIFFEELVSPKVAETIASEVGAETAVLNPLEGLTDEEIKDGEDYFSVMRENLKALEKALNQ